MRILVVAVGEDAQDPFKQLAEGYLSRTWRHLRPEFRYVKESKRKGDAAKASEEEGVLLIKATPGCFRIAMDPTGKAYTSEGFARQIDVRLAQGRPLAFLIGGASGLSPQVLAECDAIWSLSELTFPHRLAYCVLAEQIYRAGEILRGGPYHK